MSEHHRIGRYRIDAPIGEGAMANVFLAHDPSIGRAVAIKALKPEYRGDTALVDRFLAEARAAGMLSHSHIVTIYDVGEADGVPYIAMEHLQGRPLDDILRDEGRMTVERVLSLGTQVADALAYAHGRGVIHRDVKPSNILICDHGRTAKLLDFGIARIEDDLDANRTQVGQVMGTPRYMSPEQAMGLSVDARSDLFSLGAVFYEMVTGKPAFPGTGLATLAIQIAQQDPAPIRGQVRECPRGLCFIIDKLLAKKPGDRFPDAARLAEALKREGEAMTQESGGARQALALRFKLPLVLGATATVALALGVGMVLDRQNATITDMALTSGASMTDFVARNTALKIADNAGLPAEQQDWLPLQAFVEEAAKDHNVRQIIIADDHGVVRAAADRALLGSRHRASVDQAAIGVDGLRFTRTVHYAGADFGQVDIVMDRGPLDAAMSRTRTLLTALSLFVVGVIALIAYLSARELSLPLRRLRTAIDEAAGGNSEFRLSHNRNDELGHLFDAFNQMADEMEARSVGGPVGDALAALRTRIAPPATSGDREAA
ncbi:protein kinase domain-containing protein [Sphingobium bisphenolivorans]|uniref:protein kinase domain-containing protein n=1 Tax=Sphingobium bisphenolivorans TaxID=1335760 RepID=UPI0003A4E50F|nr:protein kinase [Sphingobium bisphenolivorans]